MNLYLKITALFFVLTGLLMLIGYAVGAYFFSDPLPFMFIGLILAGVVNFASYFWSDKIVVRMSGARIIQESENPSLYGVVRTVANKAGIPMPKVGIVDTPAPNAFATGRGPKNAVVVATTGILRALNQDELEAVIGHEVGHVVHRDVLTSSVAATIAGVISYVGNIALWSMMFGGYGGNGRNGGNPLLLLAAIVLVPFGAMFVQLGISRSVEYNADRYGAVITHKPGALASALLKISSMSKMRRAPQGSGSPSPATSALWIVNPFSGSSLVELFSTHPSTQHRVERLRKIGEEIGVYVS